MSWFTIWKHPQFKHASLTWATRASLAVASPSRELFIAATSITGISKSVYSSCFSVGRWCSGNTNFSDTVLPLELQLFTRDQGPVSLSAAPDPCKDFGSLWTPTSEWDASDLSGILSSYLINPSPRLRMTWKVERNLSNSGQSVDRIYTRWNAPSDQFDQYAFRSVWSVWRPFSCMAGRAKSNLWPLSVGASFELKIEYRECGYTVTSAGCPTFQPTMLFMTQLTRHKKISQPPRVLLTKS